MNPRIQNIFDGVIASLVAFAIVSVFIGILMYIFIPTNDIAKDIWIAGILGIGILSIFIFWLIKNVRKQVDKKASDKPLKGFPLAFNNKLKEIEKALSGEKSTNSNNEKRE